MLQSTGPHHTVDGTLYHCYKVSYLLTKHKLCRLFCSKMCIYCCYGNWSVTGVTGVRCKFTIWHINFVLLSAQLVPDMAYRAPTNILIGHGKTKIKNMLMLLMVPIDKM